MRVLFFNYEYPPLGGGAGNATAALVREYARMNDMEVDVVTSSLDAEYHVENVSDTVRVHRLPIGKNARNLSYQSLKDILIYTWRAYVFGRKLRREKRFDVMQAFFTLPCGLVAWLLARKQHIPVVMSLRGSDVPGYSERFAFWYTMLTPLTVFLWRQAEAVVANSAGLKELAHKSAPDQAIEVIYNGIDTEKFHPARDFHFQQSASLQTPVLLNVPQDHSVVMEHSNKECSGERRERTLVHNVGMHRLFSRMSRSVLAKQSPSPDEQDQNYFIILCASRLSRRKGFRYAIEAVAQLEKKYPEVRLVIAGGDGDAEKELKHQVKDLNLEDKIFFTGQYTPDENFVRDFYQQADVFVLPSLNEGMSNNVLEALGCGLPILMTPTGGAEELVEDGKNGFIINMKDAADIAEKLERLIGDENLRIAMGRHSRLHAERMSWKTVAEEYRGVYEEIRVMK